MTQSWSMGLPFFSEYNPETWVRLCSHDWTNHTPYQGPWNPRHFGQMMWTLLDGKLAMQTGNSVPLARVPPDAVLIITSDHARSSGEHRRESSTVVELHDELLRIPLLSMRGWFRGGNGIVGLEPRSSGPCWSGRKLPEGGPQYVPDLEVAAHWLGKLSINERHPGITKADIRPPYYPSLRTPT